MSSVSNTAPKCLYCGNNQTNHILSYVGGMTSLWFPKTNERLLASRFGKFFMHLAEELSVGIFSFWCFIRMAHWEKDSKFALGDRAKFLWEDANRRGIRMENLRILNRGTDFYRARINGRWFYFAGLPRPTGLENPALSWMDDKAVLKQKLRERGVPTPRGGSFTDFSEALAMFNSLTKPVITKPRFGSRGRHTTTFITTPEQFAEAWKVARRLGPAVMVEEHLTGAVYRGTVVGGKVRGVLAGEPPRITGDGEHTIMELIAIKDESRPEGVGQVKTHALFDVFLSRLGLTRESILEKGKTIDLTEKIGVSYGGKSIECTPETHPKFFTYLEQAAAVVDDPILGFDFIAPNIESDPDSMRWGIIECNGLPFINLHHDPLIGKPRNVAGSVWDLFEKGSI